MEGAQTFSQALLSLDPREPLPSYMPTTVHDISDERWDPRGPNFDPTRTAYAMNVSTQRWVHAHLRDEWIRGADKMAWYVGWPLPLGRAAYVADLTGFVKRPIWANLLWSALPFDGDERALFVIERATDHWRVELFGLCEPAEHPASIEVWRFVEPKLMMRGSVSKEANRCADRLQSWYMKTVHGKTVRSDVMPEGEFIAKFTDAVRMVRHKGQRMSKERIGKGIGFDRSTIDTYLDRYHLDYRELLLSAEPIRIKN